MTVDSSVALCSTSIFPESSLTRVAVLIDNIISHPIQGEYDLLSSFISRGTMWLGMPEELFPRLFVRWSGYIYADRGYHTAYLTYRDGVRLWINSELLLDKWMCVEQVQEIILKFYLSGNGYTPFRLEYFSHGGPFGIEFQLDTYDVLGRQIKNGTRQNCNGTDLHNCGLFFHIPSDPISYDSPQIRFYKNVAITSRSPILFGPILPSCYKISPSLPQGLEIGNGILFGTPTKSVTQREYTVIATNEQYDITTRLLLDVGVMSAPKSLWLENPCGKNITRLTVRQYELIPVLTLHWVGRVSSFTIHPALPKGLTFNQVTLRIEGRPIVQIPPTDYEVSAINDAGMIRCPLVLEVIGCDVGPLVYSWLAGGQGTARVIANNTVLYTNDVDTGLYGMVLCLPSSEYLFTFNCTQGEICDLALIREDGLHLLYGSYVNGIQQTQKLNLLIESTPQILLNRTIFYSLPDYPIDISFTLEGAFFPIVFSPLLPSSIQFDQERLLMTGTFPSQGTFTYSVKATNPVGSCEMKIEVYIGECPQNNTLYIFKRHFSQKGEQVMLLNHNKLLYSMMCRGGTCMDLFCLPTGDYIVRLMALNDQGWVTNSDLVILDCSDRFIASYSVEPTLTHVDYPLSLKLELEEQSSLLFFVTILVPPSSWKLPVFNDSDWQIGQGIYWGKIPAGIATVYFRRGLPLSTCASTQYMRVSALVKEGMVMYVDGVERIRVNLPEGSIYHTTLASEVFEKAQWVEELIIPSLSLPPLIAIEVHRFNVVEAANVIFDLEVRCVLSDVICWPDYVVRGSNHTVIPQHDASAVVDGDGTSFWMDSSMPVWVELSSLSGYVINRVDLQVGDSWWWEVPYTVHVIGVKKDSSEVPLLSFSSKTLFEGPYARVSLPFVNSMPYPTYRLQIDSILGGSLVQLAEVGFYREQLVFCEADGVWARTRVNELAVASCVGKLVGGQKRFCRKVDGKGMWKSIDMSGCVGVTPIYGSSFIDMNLYLTNCSLHLWESRVQRDVTKTLERVCKIHEKVTVFFAAPANNKVFGVKAHLRLDVENDERTRVWSCVSDLRNKLTDTVYQYCPESFPEGITITVVDDIVLRENHLVVWIVGGVFCVLFFVVLCWRGFYYWWNHAHAVHVTKRTVF